MGCVPYGTKTTFPGGAGIALFHRFDVLFDLTRGVTGFRPVEN